MCGHFGRPVEAVAYEKKLTGGAGVGKGEAYPDDDGQTALDDPKAVWPDDDGVPRPHRYQRSASVPRAMAMKHRQPTSAVVRIPIVSPT